jgi:glycylpeptide N-tetradecanoyltransferase
MTRRVALKGIFQAVYTSVALIPTPVSVCRYYYRPFNIPKLVEINFCQVPRDMTLSSMVEANKVADTTSLPGLREMVLSDIPQVADLFRRYQGRFDLAPEYSVEDIEHHFLSGRGNGSVGQGGLGRRTGQVTWTYVVEVTFLSFPSASVH